MNELTALENATKSIPVFGIKVHEKQQQDKRKTVNRFFVTIHGTTISPVLDYQQMNHFLLGFSRAVKLLNE